MKNNNVKFKNINLFGKITILLIGIIFWTWVLIKNIVPSGQFEAGTDFTGVNPWLPGLRPIERVVNRNIIIGDPIYLDIKLPTRFDELRLRVNYENKSKGDVRIGIFTNKDKWEILFGTKQGNEYIFNLRGLPLSKNIIPVVIGAPKATINEPVIIKNIGITASKSPFTWNDAKQLLAKPKYLLLLLMALLLVSCLLFFIALPINVSTFAVLVIVGSFINAAVLELWRPSFVVNFVDSRIFIFLFLFVSGWYWLEHRMRRQ